MPYICVVRTDLPDGVLQVLDLWPNASQRNPIYDPPAQTRYLCRVSNDTVRYVNGVTQQALDGLGAYLMDRLEPGGLGFATADIDLSSVVAGDVVSIGGVDFTATDALPDPALQEFYSIAGGGSDLVSATTLIATINDAASQALLAAAGSTVTAGPGGSVGSGDVTVTADTAGETGALSLTENTGGTTIIVSVDHLTRPFEAFTFAQINLIAAALVARMDASQTLTTTAVNAAINAVPGVSDTSIASPASGVTLAGLLSILAGRGYRVPVGATIYSGVGSGWHMTPAGGFDVIGIQNDTIMRQGEWRPVNIGGDPHPMPVRGVTPTYHTSSLDLSLIEGALYRLNAGVTLYPNTGRPPQLPWTYQHGLTYNQVTGARLVTVYDDDGTVLL